LETNSSNLQNQVHVETLDEKRKQIFACVIILLLSVHRFGGFVIKHLFKEKNMFRCFSYIIPWFIIPDTLSKIGIFIPIDGEVSFSNPVVKQF